jgi:hypothetical protein
MDGRCRIGLEEYGSETMESKSFGKKSTIHPTHRNMKGDLKLHVT